MIVTPSPATIAEAVAILRAGGLVAFPTETVYGLGANAFSDQAIRAIYRAKDRPAYNPLIVHIPSATALAMAAEVPSSSIVRRRVELLSTLWPGPLSIVLPKAKAVSSIATAGLQTVAVRVPLHPVAQALLEACDFPIAAPSANPFSGISPTTALHVQEGLGNKVSYILDGGPCKVGLESTIVTVTDPRVRILRPGGVTKERITALLGTEEVEDTTPSSKSHAPLAPGMLEQHYSPRTPLAFRADWEGRQLPAHVGLLCFSEPPLGEPGGRYESVYVLTRVGDLDEAAANLFSALRTLDAQDLELILVDRCPDDGIGLAIMDRLKRACHS